MDARRKTSACIANAIADEYSVTHIQAQSITSLQQHARTGFATGAVLLFPMWTEVDFLYLPSHFANSS
jgi:hypothetical protein